MLKEYLWFGPCPGVPGSNQTQADRAVEQMEQFVVPYSMRCPCLFPMISYDRSVDIAVWLNKFAANTMGQIKLFIRIRRQFRRGNPD